MNRMRMLLVGILTVVLTGALVGGATFALFTAQSGNATNEFQAGTLEISNSDASSWDAEFSNMAPGDTVEKTITVTNSGSLDFEFAGTTSRTGALFQGATPAQVELINGYGTLAPGASKVVTVQVTLPLGAQNAYQTLTGSLTITFHAFQTKNVMTGPATATQTNDNAYNAPRNAYYDGYMFYDGGGNAIPLTDANLLAMYEVRPGGGSNYLSADGSSDPKFWFNNAKPDGLYQYVIVTKSGMRYTASINHVGN